MLENDSVTAFQLKTPNGPLREFNEFTRPASGVSYFQNDTVIYSVSDPIHETAIVAWDKSIQNIPLRWLNFVINDTFFFSEKHIVDLGEQKVYENPFKTRATGYYKQRLLHYDYVNSEYIYLGMQDSLAIFQDKRKTTVNHGFHEADTSVWICTRDGVSNIKNGNYTTWFSGQFVTDMIADSDGNYWISTLNVGIYKVPKQGIY